MLSYIKQIKEYIINLVLPLKCFNCGAKNEIFCHNCLFKIDLNERANPPDISALYDYRHPIIKKAIWELKYHHHHFLGKKLGELLYESFQEEIVNLKLLSGVRPIYIIPVPLSKQKKRLRGYNQSLIIARGFYSCAPKRIFEIKKNIIFKKINNQPQAKIIDRNERLKNTKGVFKIKNKDQVKGRTIIIIDDVTTTGGTLNEIIGILKKAKAKKVIALALAH